MNTFKRNALAAAVLAGLGATSAVAVNRSADNTGQVLIFPYYTVNSVKGNAFNTYVSITNTTSDAKVLKVRFREGRTSAEVLDFNLYLSPNDMWVGAVAPCSNASNPAACPAVAAGQEAAMLVSGGDLSCTDPVIPVLGEPFKNFVYANASSVSDIPSQSALDRTREGYIEVFEMASLTGTAAVAVTHTAINTAPPNCATVRSPDGVLIPAGLPAATRLPPTGGLYGQGTLINVATGSNYTYNADALDTYATTEYYSTVGQNTPTIGGTQVTPNSLVQANGFAYASTWLDSVTLGLAGARAVAATFMHASVLNDYILDTNTLSNTDWVLTFPTKREMVSTTLAGDPFGALMTTAGACEPVSFSFFNRDEQSFVPAAGGFSPPGPTSGGPGVGNLCWESTVVSVRNTLAHTASSDISATEQRSGVLGSRNMVAVTVLASFQNGWMNLAFTGAGTGVVPPAGGAARGLASAAGTRMSQAGATVVAAHTFVGLPVTGFMVRTFQNDAIDCVRGGVLAVKGCQGNYGGLFRHAYRTVIR